MAISFPLTLPSSKFARIRMTPQAVVASSRSPFTGAEQVYAHQGQWWEAEIELPSLARADAAPWIATLTALNGREGTFYLGDSLGRTPRGSISGSPTVSSGATKGSTTLPITGGSGTFAVGDYLQVGTSLYIVIKVNAGSVDVFPRLRAAHANGTAITYNNAAGLFRLVAPVPYGAGRHGARGIYDPITFSAMEAL